jgi:hypothetical protein
VQAVNSEHFDDCPKNVNNSGIDENFLISIALTIRAALLALKQTHKFSY